jgi:nitroimidazol reductase NimA-like FMN-containing flavoprotein (pyridoxamine 5'-phosphate oxidase superfamily)
MLGKLNTTEIDALLSSQIIGRIGCYADDTPLITPISYVYDGEYIYAHTREGLKLNLMRKNPRVCFEVEEMKDMANWKTVIAWGEFEELKNDQDRRQGLQLLVNRILPLVSSETTHLHHDWPFASNDLHEIKGIVFRIHLKRKSGRFETNNESPSING